MSKTTTAYKKVYTEIRKAIDNGEYPAGSLLPTETQLEEKYSVSRITIRKAISMLSEDGYVTVKQGKGTTVNDPDISQNLNILTSITSSMKMYGRKVTTNNLYFDLVIPNSTILKKLQLPEGTPVVRLQRLQCTEDSPFSITTNYIIPSLESKVMSFTSEKGSFYEFLSKECGCTLDSAQDVITARTSDLSQSHMLNIPIGSPILYIKRVTFSRGMPITYDIVYIDANKYSFTVDSRGYMSNNK